MNRFRVTYIEIIERESIVRANSSEEAKEKVRAEFKNGEHHHMIDGWNGNWQSVPRSEKQTKRLPCFECGH